MRSARILLVFLLPLLASCTFSSKTSSTPSGNAPQGGVSYAEAIENTSGKIKNTPEFEECMRPSVNMCVNQVGNQLARAQKSVAFCDEMSEAGSKDACKYGVIMSQIAETKDINLCNELSDTYKKECRIGLIMSDALASSDVTKCDAIKTETATLSGSESPQNDRTEQCRSNVIMRKPDAKLSDCDALSNGQSKDMCNAIMKNRLQSERGNPRPTPLVGQSPATGNN
jgi:hypothetical protein